MERKEKINEIIKLVDEVEETKREIAKWNGGNGT